LPSSFKTEGAFSGDRGTHKISTNPYRYKTWYRKKPGVSLINVNLRWPLVSTSLASGVQWSEETMWPCWENECENPVMRPFPIERRINTELFIGRTIGLYIWVNWVRVTTNDRDQQADIRVSCAKCSLWLKMQEWKIRTEPILKWV